LVGGKGGGRVEGRPGGEGGGRGGPGTNEAVRRGGEGEEEQRAGVGAKKAGDSQEKGGMRGVGRNVRGGSGRGV